MPQRIQIVGVLISGGNRQHTRSQDVRKVMHHARRIAVIRDQRGEPIHDPHPPLGLSQKQYPGIRGDRAAVERAGDFLGTDGWKRERKRCRIGHGGGAISVR